MQPACQLPAEVRGEAGFGVKVAVNTGAYMAQVFSARTELVGLPGGAVTVAAARVPHCKMQKLQRFCKLRIREARSKPAGHDAEILEKKNSIPFISTT
jgi:hypothetical protein